jgi:hypothetical protein
VDQEAQDLAPLAHDAGRVADGDAEAVVASLAYLIRRIVELLAQEPA